MTTPRSENENLVDFITKHFGDNSYRFRQAQDEGILSRFFIWNYEVRH